MFNLTTDPIDINRFRARKELLSLMDGFDGVELLCYEPDPRNLIPENRVIGLHMCYFPYWLDFWRGDKQALLHEFGSMGVCKEYYGGTSPDVIINRFRKDIEYAKQYKAEYIVFHVSEASIYESFTRKYKYTDEEVVDSACEVLNEVFSEEHGNENFGGEDSPLTLLVENLWLSGFTFTDPEITKRLLDGISYPNKGILLDTGHLMHTNTMLGTQEEGIKYIHKMLDEHGHLADNIRGVHLHQSLTGEYAEKKMANPPSLKSSFKERNLQSFCHALNVDKHEPFTCAGVRELIERIAPEYLTLEFLSQDASNLREKLLLQQQYI